MRRTSPLTLIALAAAACSREPTAISADRCWTPEIGSTVRGTAVLSIPSPFLIHGRPSASARACPGYVVELSSAQADRAYGRLAAGAHAAHDGPRTTVVKLEAAVVADERRRPVLRVTRLDAVADPDERRCDPPWPGFHRGDDPAFRQTLGRWIEPPSVHVVEVGTATRPRLNGSERLTIDELRTRFQLLAQLQPQPFVSVDFRRGASCGTLRRVRTILDESFDCRTSERCLLGGTPVWARR